MKRATSLYLDGLRLAAAAGVFVGHANLPWFYSGRRFFPEIGHQLVVVFFFLSGYVVADATLGKGRGARQYVAARLSRLCSVVLPAVALTAVAYGAGAWLNPGFYADFNRGHEGLRWLLSASFLQELWFLSASPPSNGPLWSLGYEFWFYVLFGCAVFVSGKRARVGAVAVVALIAGPKLLLLLPVWLLGVAAWWMRDYPAPRPALARVACVGSGIAACLLAVSGWTCPGGGQAVAPWYYSGQFASDWVLGLAIASHVFFFNQGVHCECVPGWIERPVRWSAGATFSLYAYHFPLLVFCAAVVPYGHADPFGVGVVLFFVLAGIVVLWQITERRRGWWQAWFTRRLQAAPQEPACVPPARFRG